MSALLLLLLYGAQPSERLRDIHAKACGTSDSRGSAPTRQSSDLNGDGHKDLSLHHEEGGAGFYASCACVEDGASKQITCAQWQGTPYSSFTRFRVVPIPYVPPRFDGAQFGPKACAALDLSRPEQATLALLSKPATLPMALNWQPGDAAPQEQVCMSAAEAEAFPRAAWVNQDEQAEHWQVVYSPSDPSNPLTPGVSPSEGPGVRAELRGHSVLLTQEAPRSHAWVLNGEAWVDEDHKVDRWPTVRALWFTGATLHVRIKEETATELSIPVQSTTP